MVAFGVVFFSEHKSAGWHVTSQVLSSSLRAHSKAKHREWSIFGWVVLTCPEPVGKVASTCVSQSVVQASSVRFTWKFLEMQILRFQPRPSEPDTPRVGPRSLLFNKPTRGFQFENCCSALYVWMSKQGDTKSILDLASCPCLENGVI